MISIKKIAAAETYPVRHPVLRKDEPFEKCINPGDILETSFHFGLFEDEKLVAVITVFENYQTLFDCKKQFQIRGMAVLESHQKKGYGAQLINQVESYLQQHNEYVIWFNARLIAIGFYEKMRYNKVGDPFEIDAIGLHYIMFKKCNFN